MPGNATSECGHDAGIGGLFVCFLTENLETPSLQPGTYPITGNFAPSGSPTMTVANIIQCEMTSQGPSAIAVIAADGGDVSTGTVTYNVINGNNVEGTASVTFPNGDSANVTFNAVVTREGCPQSHRVVSADGPPARLPAQGGAAPHWGGVSTAQADHPAPIVCLPR